MIISGLQVNKTKFNWGLKIVAAVSFDNHYPVRYNYTCYDPVVIIKKSRFICWNREEIIIMKHKAIIFDLDGTLLNTLEDLADSVNAVLQQNGLLDILNGGSEAKND